jgi:hypothetical protein
MPIGSVSLALGWEAWTNTVIPLEIGITPPDGVLKKRLFTYANKLRVGGSDPARYRAQAFVLPQSVPFNRLRLCLSGVVGDRGSLTVRVVTGLNDADPAGANSAVWSWAGTAEQIGRAMWATPDGKVPATSGNGTVLPAGTNYVIFSCEDVNPQNYYEFHAGNNLYNGDGGPRYDHSGTAWVMGAQDPPGMGIPTFAFDVFHSPNGEIRICTDGTPDTEPWVTFPYPDDPWRTVSAPGEGLFTVIVSYSNSVDTSRNGTHLDSTVIDWTPPIINGVTIQEVNRVSRSVLMDLDVTDAGTRVANMSWRFDDGPWESDAFRRQPRIFCPPSFSTMTWVFRDAAANATAPVTFGLPVDMSAPTLEAKVERGRGYTQNTNVSWLFQASDDTAVDRICLRETRTGTEYGPFAPSQTEVAIDLPGVLIGWDKDQPIRDRVDGTYTFEAVAYDTSSNASATVIATLTLDRTPPVLESVELTGPAGEAPVSDTNLVLRINATDNLGPMEMRWRWKGETWSAWQPIARSRFGLLLSGYLPLPKRYEIDLQIRDFARLTVSGSCAVEVNSPPNTPTGIRPNGGCGDPPFLFGNDFSDPDGDRWSASQFVVRTLEGVVLDTGALHDTDRCLVPDNWLQPAQKYQWRCRYLDEHGAWSGWSQWLSFDLLPDADGDGIPDEIEEFYGTGVDNPDTDDDGIPDGLEDLNANGIVDAGETDPRATDSDSDGLRDQEEDTNANARLDPGETSPARADTDGDGANDRHEQLAGTDPRDPAVSFRLTSIERLSPGGRYRINWLARGGRSYSVMADDRLNDGVPPITLTNLTAVGGVSPWYVVPMTWEEPAPQTNRAWNFYWIRLND